ncbi:MAG: AMP-binding protein [Acidobacteria bacterium]|nr:AMP-binding protein [Acidobacteriota bacterium]
MATPGTQLDHIVVQEQVSRIVVDLLVELGSHRLPEEVKPGAHLERDLGLGSLERVELVLRIATAFHITLSDRVAAEAETLGDLLNAVTSCDASAPEAFSAAARAPMPAAPATALKERLLDRAETLTEVCLHRGRSDAHRQHLFLREDDGATRAITFGELFQRSSSIARGLRTRGLEPGEAVALMLPTSADFFSSFFGVILAGGVAVPIYPPMRADRIEEYAARQAAILRSAQAKFLISFRQAEAVARMLQPHVPTLKGVLSAAKLAETSDGSASFEAHHARPSDLAFLQYTSGSTGEPKGVMLTHANLLANIRAIVDALEIDTSDVAVSWLPLYHDMGLIGSWLLPFSMGLPLAVMSPLAFLTRPERWLWAVHQHRATIAAAPNFAFELCVRKIADRDIEGLDLSSWRCLLNGAEPVHPRTLDRFVERFARCGFRPEALMPVYGLAEATLAATVPPLGRGPAVDRIDRKLFECEGRAVPAAPDDDTPLEFVSVGRAVPRHEIRLADADGNDVPDRVEGSLWFRGPSATRGYFRNPEATREIQKGDGWVDTGDRAYRAAGEFYITGRVKDIIIKAGRNIVPHEVEEVAGGVEGIRRGCVAAFGVADEQAGTERLIIVAETRESRIIGTPASAAIEARLTQDVAGAIGMPPDVVELVPAGAIPKTSSGKLRHSETRRLFLEGKLGAGHPPAWLQVARLAARGGVRAARSTLRRVLEFFYGIYSVFAFAVFILPTWLGAYFAPSRESACRITQIGSRIFFRLMGIPITIHGREYMEKDLPCVFVSNHTSFFDIVLFLAICKIPYRFVSKIEVLSWPFIGTFLRVRDDFRFTREDRNQRLAQATALETSLREGVSLLIFPEGTFTPRDGVRPFQLGAFKAAVATGRPVCPIALRGVRNIYRDETLLPRPGSVTVTILPSLYPNPGVPEFQEIVRLRDTARAAIAQHCGEHLL